MLRASNMGPVTAGLLLLFAACATPRASQPQPPRWLAAPSPSPDRGEQCFHAAATAQPALDMAQQLARQRATAEVVQALGLRVDVSQASVQIEADGSTQVQVQEKLNTEGEARVWGLVQRGEYWREVEDGRFDAHARVCVSEQKLDEMRAELAEAEAAAARLAEEALAIAEEAASTARIPKLCEQLDVARKACAKLSPGAARTRADAGHAALSRRLLQGLRVTPQGEPFVIAAAEAETQVQLRVAFEEQGAPQLQLRCRSEPELPCKVTPSDTAGLATLTLGPGDTRGLQALKLRLSAEVEALSEWSTELTLAARVDPRSVLLCPAQSATAKAAAKALAKLKRLTMVDPQHCEADDPSRYAALVVKLSASARCKRSLGDHDCRQRYSAKIAHGEKLREVSASAAHIHPKRRRAQSKARSKALRSFSRKLRKAVARAVKSP